MSTGDTRSPSGAGRSFGPAGLDLSEAMAGVPDFDRFATVDELEAAFADLAARHPERTALRRIGTSRLGDAISELTIDGGPGRPHAVVFAFPHPNEPIGGLTALHLARRLLADDALRDRLGHTWHVVPCIDPDGTRLNEGWFSGPFTRSFYGRRFYRPPGHEQVEWTFPFAYKRAYFDRVLPETQALMRLIDDTRPTFMCSLHNGEYGGVYYYLSRPAPPLYPTLHAIAEHVGLPLDTGEPEVPFVTRYAPAIFQMIQSDAQYDFAESVGLDPTDRQSGTSSADYAGRYGTLSLVSELPYWLHPDVDDTSATDERYADVLRRVGADLDDLHRTLAVVLAAFEAEQPVGSPFLRASQVFVPLFARLAVQNAERANDPANDRAATVAERFGCEDVVQMFRIRFGGMLLRAIDGEMAIGHGTPGVRAQHAALTEIYASWTAAADADMQGEAIPIAKLVGVQYAAILAAVDHVLAERG